MQLRLEDEPPAVARFLQGPAGKYASNFSDVLLRVTPVHAEGMQLHKLAGVVFIQPIASLRLSLLGAIGLGRSLRSRGWIRHRPRSKGAVDPVSSGIRLRRTPRRPLRIRPFALPVVQVKQHRRTLSGRHQQVLELAQYMR